ncbi:MAG: FAD-binding oxidoreductase [Bacteroidia bacterium]|nr:FAD-binding oxidoreductase [Bacteroidia bacterium]
MKVSGWGGYLWAQTQLLPYEGLIRGRGIVRGLGRSYGDASFYGKGYTWHTRSQQRILKWEEGTLVAEAGLSLYDLIRHILPKGWFPPVVPGTQFVTLGGAFASNIHGKNHHVEGSFADHIDWIELRLPSGELRRLTPAEELFWATAGGMGLTGVIERLQLRLIRIPSSVVHHEVRQLRDWEALLSAIEAEEMHYPYAVAWVDHTDWRSRGILHLGRFAEAGELTFRRAHRLAFPITPPFSLIGRLTVELISAYYWRKYRPGTRLTSYAEFFFPLDGIQRWNSAWGRRGFVQFQFVVEKVVSLERLWRELQAAPARSFLTVLKRLGPQRGPLAFSGPGWTLAIDLPATREVRAFLVRLADLVAEEGGRIYLTKDSLLLPQQARAMYPNWETFRQIKAQVDPEGCLRSDLSERLRLTE